jgi:hypothetical protein
MFIHGYKQMQSYFPPAALSLTWTVLVWVVGAVAGTLRTCEQPGTETQAELARRCHWRRQIELLWGGGLPQWRMAPEDDVAEPHYRR